MGKIMGGWRPTQQDRDPVMHHPVVRAILKKYDLATPGIARGIWDLGLFTVYDIGITEEIALKVLDHAVKSQREYDARYEQRTADRVDEPGALVYYLRLGNRCKIGTTTNLAERLKAIRCEEVLATEPGGYLLERKRHHQFWPLRAVGEWFRYEEPLTSHVAALAGQRAA